VKACNITRAIKFHPLKRTFHSTQWASHWHNGPAGRTLSNEQRTVGASKRLRALCLLEQFSNDLLVVRVWFLLWKRPAVSTGPALAFWKINVELEFTRKIKLLTSQKATPKSLLECFVRYYISQAASPYLLDPSWLLCFDICSGVHFKTVKKLFFSGSGTGDFTTV